MRYFFVLIFSAVLFFGCGEQDTKIAVNENKYAVDSSDLKMESVSNPNEAFQMQYKFEQGKPYNYRISMLSEVDQTTTVDSAMSMKMHQSMIYLISLTPKETDSEGNTELNVVINSARIKMEGSGRSISYDSDSIKTAEDKEKFADHHALINNAFSVRMNKSGELLEVFKADKIVNSFLEFKHMKDSANADEKNNLRSQIVESMLKPLIGSIFVKMPEKNIAKDSVWERKQPARQMMVFQVTQTSKYKVDALQMLNNDKVAVVDLKTETTIAGETKHVEQGISYNFTKPNISAQGKLYFNIDKGFVQRIKSETEIQTFVTAEASTPAGIQKRSNKESIKTTNIIEKI